MLCQASQALNHVRSARIGMIDRLVLVILCMEQQGFEPERFAFKPAILNVVVRRGVVHQIFNRCLRLVTVEDRLGLARWLHVWHWLLLLAWGPHLLRLLLGLVATGLLLLESSSLLGARHNRSLWSFLLEFVLFVFVCSSIWVALKDLLDLFDVRV